MPLDVAPKTEDPVGVHARMLQLSRRDCAVAGYGAGDFAQRIRDCGLSMQMWLRLPRPNSVSTTNSPEATEAAPPLAFRA